MLGFSLSLPWLAFATIVWLAIIFHSKIHFNLNIFSRHRSCESERENRIVQIHWVWKDFFIFYFWKGNRVFHGIEKRLLSDILISLLWLFCEGFSESHIRGSRLLIFINRERIWKRGDFTAAKAIFISSGNSMIEFPSFLSLARLRVDAILKGL